MKHCPGVEPGGREETPECEVLDFKAEPVSFFKRKMERWSSPNPYQITDPLLWSLKQTNNLVIPLLYISFKIIDTVEIQEKDQNFTQRCAL